MNSKQWEFQNIALKERPYLSNDIATKNAYSIPLYHLLHHFTIKENKTINKDSFDVIYQKDRIESLVDMISQFRKMNVGIISISDSSSDAKVIFENIKTKYRDDFLNEIDILSQTNEHHISFVIKCLDKHKKELLEYSTDYGLLSIMTFDTLITYSEKEIIYITKSFMDNQYYMLSNLFGYQVNEMKLALLIENLSRYDNNLKNKLMENFSSKFIQSFPSLLITNNIIQSKIIRGKDRRPVHEDIFIALFEEEDYKKYLVESIDIYYTFYMRKDSIKTWIIQQLRK
jgi:hypothetical protein